MKKKLFFVTLFLFGNLAIFAFEYKVTLQDKYFKKIKYNFSVLKVVDGRLNKQKPIGFIVERIHQQLKQMWVGNDSLEGNMNAFFKSKSQLFDTSLKIMLVVNQCNLRHIYGYSATGGKEQEVEIKISLDYYKLNGDKCELIYQQYYKYTKDAKFISKATKAINASFSEAIRFALIDFNQQVALKKIPAGEGVTLDSLLHFIYNKHSQLVTNQNIKDGLYFSCKDVYLNKPGIFKDFSFDTSLIGIQPILITTNSYTIGKAFAIVKQKRIFVYINNNSYREALLSNDGELYFPNVTRTILSENARVGSNAVGIAGAVLPLGFIGAIASAITQSAIKKAGTTQTKTDIIVDFETGDLTYRE
jgi:hypothetical protein